MFIKPWRVSAKSIHRSVGILPMSCRAIAPLPLRARRPPETRAGYPCYSSNTFLDSPIPLQAGHQRCGRDRAPAGAAMAIHTVRPDLDGLRNAQTGEPLQRWTRRQASHKHNTAPNPAKARLSASRARSAFEGVGSMKISMSSVAREYPWTGKAVAPMITNRTLCSLNDLSSSSTSMSPAQGDHLAALGGARGQLLTLDRICGARGQLIDD
jgi:hypothetical protein